MAVVGTMIHHPPGLFIVEKPVVNTALSVKLNIKIADFVKLCL